MRNGDRNPFVPDPLAGRTQRWLRRHAAQRPGRGEASVAALISPYRYDVVVRAQFFSFLAAHPELAEEEPAELLSAIGQQPYGTWFRSLALARFHPRVAARPGRADRAMLTRVHSARRLAERAQQGGLAAMPPITARVSGAGACTETGIRLAPRLHLADGGHRLALIALSGQGTLPDSSYRVFSSPVRRMLDNTAALLGPLGIGTERYLVYLSLGVTGRPRTRADDLLADVAELHPERLPEIEAVLERHVPLLADRDATGGLGAVGSPATAWQALLAAP